MENLELQTHVINLGKIIVQQLGIDDNIDTLSRWMAHYIAEKITLAETLPLGEEKDKTKKECFETIIKLWEHRWLIPSQIQPLADFESILRVLEKINPENEDPFFHRLFNQDFLAEENDTLNPQEMIDNIKTVLHIDKTARIWISYILNQSACKAKNENTALLLKSAMNLPNNDDIKTIELILNDQLSLDSENEIEENYKNKYYLETLKKRIDELEKYAELNKLILNNYKSEICDIKGI